MYSPPAWRPLVGRAPCVPVRRSLLAPSGPSHPTSGASMSANPELSTLAETNLKAIRRGRYVVDPAHTRVLFSVSHFGFSTYFGEFTGTYGMLLIPAAVNDGAVQLAVSVPVDNVSTSNRTLDDELRSSDWLDAQSFPLLSFAATSPVSLADNTFNVTGALSLHGVTRQVSFDATFVGAGINPKKQVYTIGFDIRGHIRRSDYGVTAGLPLIGDELNLIISAAFELESGSA